MVSPDNSEVYPTAIHAASEGPAQAPCPHVWRPIATAPVGYDGKRWTYVLFRGTSKGRSFPGAVVVQGWMGKTHDGRLEPVHSYSYKLNIDAWMPVPDDAPAPQGGQ